MSNYASRFNDDFGGGGGFMNAGSQANNSPGGNRRPDQVLRPVTIKQLLEAVPSNTDTAVVIQDVELSNVSFCAVVRGINRNATNVLLQVEDGTGGIEVRKWIEASDGETEGLDIESGIQEHDWIKVIGSPKIFNGKKHVAGLRLQKIEDFNQINYHFLEVINVTLSSDRGTGVNSMNIDRSNFNGNSTKQIMINPINESRNPKQVKIMEFFQRLNELPDEGVHVQDIARGCNFDLRDVCAEISKLISEGELYTTVDDDHVMPTNS